MRYLIALFFIALFLLSASVNAEQGLSDEKVRMILSIVDQASADEDLDTIGLHLAENFRMRMNSPGEAEIYELDRHQYLGHLLRGYELVDDYSFSRTDISVKVASDGQSASSTSKLLEFITLDEQRLSFTTQQITFYELEEGRAVITSVDSTIEKIRDSEMNAL